MLRFTKIYDEERRLLRKANNVNAYEVYMHLKNDNSFYKNEFYDLTRCIAEYLDMSYDMVKRAMKKLKDVGLVQTTKKGKVNYYTLPYDNNTENEIADDNRGKGVDSDDKGTNCPTGEREETVYTEEVCEREEEPMGEDTNRVPERKIEELTDEKILELIRKGFEADYIVNNWRRLIS